MLRKKTKNFEKLGEIMLLTPIQIEIVAALRALRGKSKFTEAVLAKKIRELKKIDSKKKAGIGLVDLEKAVQSIEEAGEAFFSLTLNSSNDILIENSASTKFLSQEARQRRLKSEKSMSILTGGDLNSKPNKKNKIQKRTKRESLDIYGDWDD